MSNPQSPLSLSLVSRLAGTKKPAILMVVVALFSTPSLAQTCAGLMELGIQANDIRAATDMSADGSVIVGVGISAPSFQAFRWTAAGGAQFIGDGTARGISADGSVVVGDSGGSAFRWTATSGMQDLGTLGGAYSNARGVNADGSVVVGDSGGSAFRWTTASGMQDLGTGVAHGVNFDGSVVVGESGGNAFRWTASNGMQNLGPGIAHDVNSDGSVTVGSSGGRAVRWTAAGGMQDIGLGAAFGVNADGSVIVGSDGIHAHRWTLAEGWRDLGWGVGASFALAVSEDGSVTAGNAYGGEAVRGQSSILGDTYCRPTVANSTGCGGIVLANGDPRLATGSLELTATLLPLSSFGFFLTSQTQGNVANAGGSQGILCLGGSIGRFVGPGQVMDSGASGSFTLEVDLNSVPAPTLTGSVAVQPGETWNFQAWHRDTNPTLTSNFTDAVSVTFQ